MNTVVTPTGHDRYEIEGNMRLYQLEVIERTDYENGVCEHRRRWITVSESQL